MHYGIEPGPEPPPPPASLRLAAVGRLIPIKGFDLLLRAFGRARDRLPALTLEIAGAGPLDAELRANAPDGVTFLGRVSPATEVYERNAIVIVPSRGEGFGMVALEAAERGRPAIVTAVGGLPEIVADAETGVVVPPEDIELLARAIVTLAGDEELVRSYGAAARRRALDQFSAEAAADGVELVYRDLLNRRSIGGAREHDEHEVERNAVARRPGEDHRRDRVVEEQARGEHGEDRVDGQEEAGEGEQHDRDRPDGLDDAARRVAPCPLARSSLRLVRARIPEKLRRLHRELGLLARMVRP